MRETMAKEEELKKSPRNLKSEDEEKSNPLFSPGFRSVAAMAGWDEEALLLASLVVEDTPDRNLKQKRTDVQNFHTSPTNTRRKRRARRSSPAKVLNLDEVECENKSAETQSNGNAESKKMNDESKEKSSHEPSSSTSSDPPVIPCIDKLREELSCAICLEICFEPSTTPCGHSFCKKCLRSAADKCGKKCPKCRQLVSNGRSCTVNTVLWNTIQLLFPQEVEARKAIAGSSETQQQNPSKPRHQSSRNRTVVLLNSPEIEHQNQERTRRRSSRHSGVSNRGVFVSVRSRRELLLSQDEDAALASRLQREEFMGAFRDSDEQGRSSIANARSNYRDSEEHRRNSIAVARANLRAMASRATNNHTRSRGT